MVYLRSIFAAAGLAYLVFGWLYRTYLPGSFPMPMSQRVGASLFFFAIIVLSYLSDHAKKNPEFLMYLGVSGAISHLIYLAFVNDYRLNYALSLIVVMLVVNFLMTGDRKLKWFNVAVSGGVISTWVLGADRTFSGTAYLVSFVFISTISYLLSSAKLRAREEYEQLFRQSPVGLLRADPQGRIKDYNDEFLEMLGDPSEEDLEGIDVFELLGLSPEDDLKEASEENYVSLPWEKEFWVNCNVKPVSGSSASGDVILACNDVSFRKEAEERIEHVTFHDDLTGLRNRTFYNQVVDDLNREERFPFSIIFIDVDKLKLVNDAFGHSMGDELLKKVSEVIEGSCREEDLVFRWGGDEIVILLPDTRAEVRKKVRERICARMREAEFEPIDLLFSTGGSTAERKIRDESFDYLLQEAEERMYERKLERQKEVSRKVLSTIMGRLEERSPYVIDHMRRVEEISLELGKELGMKERDLEELGKAARYHDIGKVVEDQITLKRYRGELTDEEREELKNHCNVGYQIARELGVLSGVARVILHHHEWWDGSGYPRGVAGEEIPYASRVISVANFYDLLTSPRNPGERGASKEEALQEIGGAVGSRFDPEVTESFLSMVRGR